MKSILQKISFIFICPIIINPALLAKAQLESITSPGARIAIISITTQDKDRLKFNWMNKESLTKYVNKWGYDLHYYTGVLDPKRSPHWSKIPAFQEHMNVEKYDWLVWIDDDMIITNPEIKIETFIERYGKNKNFITQVDHYQGSLINSGIFLLRVSAWGNNFLNEAYEIGAIQKREWGGMHEQSSFIDMLSMPGYKEKMVVLQYKELQGFDNPGWRWKQAPFKAMLHLKWAPGDFIMHVSGQDGNTRQKRFSEVIKALNL